MPEISAQDLRRLQALEEKLEKAQGEKKTFTVERRELRARATVAERAAKSAGKSSSPASIAASVRLASVTSARSSSRASSAFHSSTGTTTNAGLPS